MKKILVFVVSLMIVFSLIPFPCSAVTTTTLNVSSVSGKRGDTVNVAVSISYGSNMQACSFDLLYDSKVVEVVSATKGPTLSSSPIINPNTLGKIVFSYASTTATTSSAALLNVQFKIKDSAIYGESAISLNMKDLSDGSFDPINYTVKNGKVTVLAPKLESPFDFETVSLGSDNARILWSAVDEATGYNIYLNGNLVSEAPVSDNVYSLEGLEADTDYIVQITTMHYTVESDKSAEYEIHTNKANVTVSFVYLLDSSNNQEFGYTMKEVEYGSTVEPPVVPEVSGLRLIGWDKPLTNITEPTIIYAQYELIGDANLDGKVNIRDVTVIQRHVAEYEILTGSAFLAADADGNGVININDATLLQMYLAEYDVVLGKQS